MILDALNLMVPLLEGHLGLSRSGLTTEGVNSGGANPQCSCDHAEEVANIGGRLGDLLVTLRAHYTSTPPCACDHHPCSYALLTAAPRGPPISSG